MNLETRWSVNESLLQSYRSIFISSQSFLLAVGALTFDKKTWVMVFLNILLAVMSLIMIRKIWLPVVRSRRRIVDYYKYTMDLPEDKQKEFITTYSEDAYIHDGKARDKANAFLQDAHKWDKKISDLRETRKKVDVFIPWGFTLVWIFFMAVSMYQLIQLFIT